LRVLFFKKGFAGVVDAVDSGCAALLNFRKGFAAVCGVVDSDCATLFFRKGFPDGAGDVEGKELASLRRNGLTVASAGCANWILFFEGSKRPGWMAFASGFGAVVEMLLGWKGDAAALKPKPPAEGAVSIGCCLKTLVVSGTNSEVWSSIC
jgi:hypothetical protein